MQRSIAALVCAASALAAYALVVRPRLLRWGTTDEERRSAWPGDEMAGGRAHFGSIRATTIEASPPQVWRWLERIGHDPVQQRFVGDTVWFPRQRTPGGQSRLVVGYLERNRAMILIAPEDWQRQIQGKPIAGGTWGFILRPTMQDGTRLIVRSVWGCGPFAPARFSAYLRELPHFVWERAMMRGLKALAERSRHYRSVEEEPAGRRALRGLS